MTYHISPATQAAHQQSQAEGQRPAAADGMQQFDWIRLGRQNLRPRPGDRRTSSTSKRWAIGCRSVASVPFVGRRRWSRADHRCHRRRRADLGGESPESEIGSRGSHDVVPSFDSDRDWKWKIPRRCFPCLPGGPDLPPPSATGGPSAFPRYGELKRQFRPFSRFHSRHSRVCLVALGQPRHPSLDDLPAFAVALAPRLFLQPVKNVVVAFFQPAQARSGASHESQTKTHVAVLRSHPCDHAACRILHQAAKPLATDPSAPRQSSGAKGSGTRRTAGPRQRASSASRPGRGTPDPPIRRRPSGTRVP